MKTKFIKVSVQERLPTKTNKYFTDKGLAIFGEVMRTWHLDNLRIYPNYWLEEVPDLEEEMREMLERMKINLLFVSEKGFNKLLTDDEIEKFTNEIDELLQNV